MNKWENEFMGQEGNYQIKDNLKGEFWDNDKISSWLGQRKQSSKVSEDTKIQDRKYSNQRLNRKKTKRNLSNHRKSSYAGTQNRQGNVSRRRGRYKKRRISKLGILLVILVVLAVIGGLALLFNNDAGSKEENISAFSDNFWDSKLYIGEDIINGSKQGVAIPKEEYNKFVEEIGGEENAEKIKYFRDVGHKALAVNYIKRGSVFSTEPQQKLIALTLTMVPENIWINI